MSLKQTQRRSWLSASWALWAVLLSAPACAAVSFTCAVTSSSMNFGIYNPLSAIGNSITASWTVTCTAVGSGSASVAGSLALSTGSSGTYTSRTMRSGANVLNYNVYETPSNTVVYGDGTAGTFTPTAAGTVSAGQQYVVAGTFYGFVPPLQNVSPGSYSDVLVITVSY